MSVREPVSRKNRFEVFKRDKFTCQYCGARAPDVVLQVDHIHPVAEGGKSEILNLVTACVSCNGGKGARKLDDQSVLAKQHAQIEELESRREQLEMLLAWRDAAVQAVTDDVDVVAARLIKRTGLGPNKSGLSHIRRWLRTFSLEEVLVAADEALDVYLRYKNEAATVESWELAFKKIPGIANIQRLAKDRPYLPRLFYVQGILRKRFSDPRFTCVDALEQGILETGASVELLERIAKRADDWGGFKAAVEEHVAAEEDELIKIYVEAVGPNAEDDQA